MAGKCGGRKAYGGEVKQALEVLSNTFFLFIHITKFRINIIIFFSSHPKRYLIKTILPLDSF